MIILSIINGHTSAFTNTEPLLLLIQSTLEAFYVQFETVPDLKVPPLCEIWNWQGDTSVLPYKFESVLNSASTLEEHYKHGELKQKYIKDARFNPDGFFFLTYRS